MYTAVLDGFLKSGTIRGGGVTNLVRSAAIKWLINYSIAYLILYYVKKVKLPLFLTN
jgi:hypothetical protein